MRYRDWGLLRYWFRGVENFAPWVRTIHFITWGHIPKWLNEKHEKLHIVRHTDYLSPKVLPTFNSNALEIGMHRIRGLADHFVYFNDDMFLLRPIEPTTFFRKGLPCDSAVLSPVMPIWGEWISRTVLNNLFIINKHFEKKQVLKAHPGQWITLRYGTRLLRTLCLLPWRHFPGFYNDHLPVAYLRETFEHVWEEERDLLCAVEGRRFRSYQEDVSHWLMRYWQWCSGCFVPVSARGKDLPIGEKSTWDTIRQQRYSMICINDVGQEKIEYERVRHDLMQSFETILPQVSRFEKSI